MKKFRLYYDKDKEEKWLNEMCESGYALKKFWLGIYTFEECEKGEYSYRIDLLPNWQGDREHFVSFMEETGVEYVCQWYRWIFMRKKASEGIFELYSDTESLIQHYARIRSFFVFVFWLEILCGIMEVTTFPHGINPVNFGTSVFAFCIGGCCLSVILKCSIKIAELKKR